MRSSLGEVNWITSQRSTFIMRPNSETITVRKRSRLIADGSVNARRLMMPSRASCILILRSSERDWAVSDMGIWFGGIITNGWRVRKRCLYPTNVGLIRRVQVLVQFDLRQPGVMKSVPSAVADGFRNCQFWSV